MPFIFPTMVLPKARTGPTRPMTALIITSGPFTPDAATQRNATQRNAVSVNTHSLQCLITASSRGTAVIEHVEYAESVHSECDIRCR